MNEVDFQGLCRICLNDSHSHSYIFEERISDHYLVFEVMTDVCQLDVTMGDGYPEFLCSECHIMLSGFQSFKRKAHTAWATLQQMKREIDTKNFQNEELNDEYVSNSKDGVIAKGGSDGEAVAVQVIKQEEEEEEYFESNDVNAGNEPELQCNFTETEVHFGPYQLKHEVLSFGNDSNPQGEEEVYNDKVVSIKEEPVEELNEEHSAEKILSESYGDINPAVRTMGAQTVLPTRDVLGYRKVPMGPKPFECLECNRRFTKKNDLARHLRLHTGEKDFPCHVCEKKFIRRISLKQHMRQHTGERPFECHFCGKSYTMKSSLVTHLRLHTGDNRCECHVCGKRFTGKRYLMEHVRMHTGEKPYECKVCRKRFSCSSYMVRHGKTHLF